MKKPNLIQFFIGKEEKGGYYAKSLLFPIFTQGETLDEVAKNIQEAVDVHFENDVTKVPVLVNFELSTIV